MKAQRKSSRTCLGLRSTAAVVGLLTTLSGCAANSANKQPPEPPRLEPGSTVTLEAREAVGYVVPILIKKIPRSSVEITPTSFGAITNSGRLVPALSTEDAAAAAGGADKLRTAITDKSAAAMVAEEVVSGPAISVIAIVYSGGLGFFVAPFATAYGIFNGVRLVASPAQRLDYVAYHGDKSLPFYSPGPEGFVFFPTGSYRDFETRFHLKDSRTGLEADTTIFQPWPIVASRSEREESVQ
ncbi:MAG TPA: hypothetical protein VLI44_01095 [Sporolactobacillaceae bacterium]|nr:hypothetical protein [Sporolactobacillaceae bacterium]